MRYNWAVFKEISIIWKKCVALKYIINDQYSLDIVAYLIYIPNIQLHVDSLVLHDPTAYKRLFGRLIYLTITKPDISFSVQCLSWFMSKLTQLHYQATLRVLKYLKGSLAQGLLSTTTNSLKLKAYCNADWARCPLTRRSVTSFWYFLVFLWFLGNQRNKQPFQDLLLNLNRDQW